MRSRRAQAMQRIRKQDVRRIGRHMLYAAALRIVIGIVKSLFKKGLSKAFVNAVVGELFSLNPLKWAAVVGGLSSFRVVQALLTGVVPMSSFVAGALSAAPALVMENKTRTELMLYFLARVVHSVSVNNVLPMLPKAMQEFEHYDVLTMMAASSEILYTHLFLPKCHLPSYQAFLERATLSDPRVLAATAAAHTKTCCPPLVEVALERTLAVDPSIPDTRLLCDLFHHGGSCNAASARFVAKHMTKLTLPLYLPLKGAAQVVLHWKKTLADPVGAAWKTMKSSAKSALFLTVYCASAMRIICLFAQFGIRSECGIALFAGGVTGATVLIEEKSRRLDLAIYCLMQAIRSTTLLLYHRGIIAFPTARLQTAVYIASMGYLYAVYDADSSKLHPTLRKMFGMFLEENCKESSSSTK